MVNAGLFKNYVGRRVTTVVKVLRTEGGTLVGQAPDGLQVSVRQAPHSGDASQFVEVIGVVEGDNSMRAEICTNFGDKFGTYLQLERESVCVENIHKLGNIHVERERGEGQSLQCDKVLHLP